MAQKKMCTLGSVRLEIGRFQSSTKGFAYFGRRDVGAEQEVYLAVLLNIKGELDHC